MVSSYTDTSATTELNQVVREYNHLGMLSKEYQEHEGTKDGNTLYVQYNFDDTVSSGEYAKAMRPESVRYPNAGLVHLTCGSSLTLALPRSAERGP